MLAFLDPSASTLNYYISKHMMKKTYSFFMQANFTILRKTKRRHILFFMQANFTILRKNNYSFKQTGRFFRAHINTAQNLLNIAPRGSKQGVFWALTHTDS